MTVDETPPPASTVSQSGGGRADQGGVANTGVIHGGVRSEFHVHHEHHHYPAPGWRPRFHRSVSRRSLIRAAAGWGLGASATAVAWRYAPGPGHRSLLKPDVTPRARPSATAMSETDEPYDTEGRLIGPAGATVWSVALGTLRGEPLAVVGRSDGSLQLWNPVAGKARGRPLPGHRDKVFGLALHGAMAVSGSIGGDLLVWDVTSDPPRSTVLADGITDGVNGVALGTVEGRIVAVSASGDRTVRVWDPANPGRSGRVLGSVLTAAVNSVAVGVVDRRTIAVTGSADGAVTLWDVTGERMLRRLGSHRAKVWALAVGAVDGVPVAVSGSEDGVLRKWALGMAQSPGETLVRLPKAVKSVAIGELAGRTVAVAACDDSSVSVWDLGTGDTYGRGLTGPTAAAQAIAISDFTGRPTVVSGHYDGTIWAWTP
ncbi:WD40 repeat domain-containing protein [Actinoplanes sp. CA-252034]|uniref:WD40 repeat domain-containing protein n=1 Tax=Actinoplanes sp. CA-252034 TaxID=3239906 RepID=UPI003D983CF5